jgi:hypothetical protein
VDLGARNSYLDSLARITSLRYVPSDDDVLKARLKTLGVVEHTFSLETGKERGVDWKIYDVGGYVCLRTVTHGQEVHAKHLSLLVREVKYVSLMATRILCHSRSSHCLASKMGPVF